MVQGQVIFIIIHGQEILVIVVDNHITVALGFGLGNITPEG